MVDARTIGQESIGMDAGTRHESRLVAPVSALVATPEFDHAAKPESQSKIWAFIGHEPDYPWLSLDRNV
jgi:hypothetical protein